MCQKEHRKRDKHKQQKDVATLRQEKAWKSFTEIGISLEGPLLCVGEP